jgi:hypothetical protein
MEMGAAHSAGVPVFSTTGALDITVGEYVRRVSSYDEAVRQIGGNRSKALSTALLLDPELVIDESINALSELRPSLTGKSGNRSSDSERQLETVRRNLSQTLGLTGANA